MFSVPKSQNIRRICAELANPKHAAKATQLSAPPRQAGHLGLQSSKHAVNKQLVSYLACTFLHAGHVWLAPWQACCVQVTPGSHSSEHAVNKQLADKERVAAALENPNLLDMVNRYAQGIRGGHACVTLAAHLAIGSWYYGLWQQPWKAQRLAVINRHALSRL
eukprot:scaffold136913_cov17-Tisochrysis_lutea.AAC.2